MKQLNCFLFSTCLFLSVLNSSFAEGEAGNSGTLVVAYDTGPQKERLDRVRFWLKNQNSELQMYPKGNAFVEDKKDFSRMVVIEGLSPGAYDLIFVYPNRDRLFETVETQKIIIYPKETVKINQEIKPRYASLSAAAAIDDYPIKPCIRLENSIGKLVEQGQESIRRDDLLPGSYTLVFEKIDGYIAPPPYDFALEPNDEFGPIVVNYEKAANGLNGPHDAQSIPRSLVEMKKKQLEKEAYNTSDTDSKTYDDILENGAGDDEDDTLEKDSIIDENLIDQEPDAPPKDLREEPDIGTPPQDSGRAIPVQPQNDVSENEPVNEKPAADPREKKTKDQGKEPEEELKIPACTLTVNNSKKEASFVIYNGTERVYAADGSQSKIPLDYKKQYRIEPGTIPGHNASVKPSEYFSLNEGENKEITILYAKEKGYLKLSTDLPANERLYVYLKPKNSRDKSITSTLESKQGIASWQSPELIPGEWVVTLHAPEKYVAPPSQIVQINADQTVIINPKLTEARELTVTTNSTYAIFTLRSTHDANIWRASGESYTFKGLQPGKYTLDFTTSVHGLIPPKSMDVTISKNRNAQVKATYTNAPQPQNERNDSPSNR